MNNQKFTNSNHALTQQIKQWGLQLGFQQVGISTTNLDQAEIHLKQWLDKGFHGEMTYMIRHGKKRSQPKLLVADTTCIITVRMDYLPQQHSIAKSILNQPDKAYIARYALGRDYHKLIRKRLQLLATRIEQYIGNYNYRVFCDSAPVLECALAEKSGQGWIGKNTTLINQHSGSWFFLAELFTNLPLIADMATTNHCGNCQACLDICPTQAIVAPYQLDARRCISYLTIELHGSIPQSLRPLIGNRIYGCDDCQLICPWNRFAKITHEPDFKPRHHLDNYQLVELFGWDEHTFNHHTEGSAIRRIGHHRLLRNIAVALGNSTANTTVIKALKQRLEHPSELVREHTIWALDYLMQQKIITYSL